MNDDVRRLLRWLVRAQPPRGALWRALLGATVASATNVGLLVGAVALLVVSATRPGLAAVLGVLIVIELLAFLRSPLRFAERLSSHRLGFEAVTRWRRWLVATIGRWTYTTWRSYAAGDLLERSLRDTDELQDLWLRCVIPIVGTLATLVLGDVVIAILPSHGGRWSTFAIALALLQLLGLAGLASNVGALIRAERALRAVRALYQSTLVELSAVTPELVLLGRGAYASDRCEHVREALGRAERTLRRQRRATIAVGPVVVVAALAVLVARHPSTSPTWTVVATLLALSSFEALGAVRGALDTAVSVSAAAERLEHLDSAVAQPDQAWPHDTTVRITNLTLVEDGVTLLDDASLTVLPGRRVAITGPSGTGKSTLLRVAAALDRPATGTVSIGGVDVSHIEETVLRQHLIYVPSEPGLTRGFALDVVQLGRTTSRDVHADLASLGLHAERTTKWSELSRGERARVAVARALVTSPSIFLFDEPTSGLGRDETEAVLALVASTGASVLIATHDPLVMAWCDEVVELAHAQLRAI